MAESTPVKRCTDPDHEGPNPLPVGEFYLRYRSRPTSWMSRCKTCVKRRVDYWKRQNPERVRENDRHRGSPEKRREWARARRLADPGKHNAALRKYRSDTRGRVLSHYGSSCGCCGTTENLTIDHVAGGGAAHRRQVFGRRNGGGADFYAWLIANGFPDGYQVLCRPCNSSKADGERCRMDHEPAA